MFSLFHTVSKPVCVSQINSLQPHSSAGQSYMARALSAGQHSSGTPSALGTRAPGLILSHPLAHPPASQVPLLQLTACAILYKLPSFLKI